MLAYFLLLERHYEGYWTTHRYFQERKIKPCRIYELARISQSSQPFVLPLICSKQSVHVFQEVLTSSVE